MIQEHTKPEILNIMEIKRDIFTEPIYGERKKVNEGVLKLKYISMSDIVINRCYGCGGKATFNATIFKRLFGNSYREMLLVMSRLGLIILGDYHKGHARTIWLNDWNTTSITTENPTIIKNRERLKSLLPAYKKRLPYRIAIRYKESLKKVTLNKEEAIEYINKRYSDKFEVKVGEKILHTVEEKDGVKQWRIAFVEGFATDDEPKRDNNGRIYHPLTNMPTDLLQFTNIKYEMDAANCHPMLFVRELRKHYRIDDDTLEQISNCIIPKDFDSSLPTLINELRKEISFKLPKDVIEYILLTFKGKFWDINLKKYNVINRSEIKQNFFGEVFYSYNNNTVSRDMNYSITREKTYAKDFRESYPNVWKVLGMIKKEGKKKLVEENKKEEHLFNECLNKVTSEVLGKEIKVNEDYNVKVKNNVLPNRMMKLESEIFTKILEKLLVNYDVINIHDAICVIDTEKNMNLTPSEVEKVMLDVFKKYHLYPTIKLNVPQNELME